MKCVLQIKKEGLNTDQLRDVTLSLCKDIINEVGVDTKPIHERTNTALSKEGFKSKGDLISAGSLVLELINAGTLSSLFELLQSYFLRDKELNISFTTEDGTSFDLTAKNLSKDQFAQSFDLAESLKR